jgi:hypothetical protein
LCVVILEQACRGIQQDKGKMLKSAASAQIDGPKNATYRLPAHADFLTAYSTAPSNKDKRFDKTNNTKL